MLHCRLLEELYLSEKRYGELLRMFLSERQEQSQHLADQLGVPLPPLLLGAMNTPAGKRLCQEEGGAATHSPASTLDSTSSANTVTALSGEVRKSVTGGVCSFLQLSEFLILFIWKQGKRLVLSYQAIRVYFLYIL